MRLEEEELRRPDGVERARYAGAGGERAGALDCEERRGVVGVERVAVGVRDEDVGRERADPVGDLDERVPVDLERVVAEVEALELRAERRRRPPGLAVADLLHPLDRLAGLLPELAGLSALAVREREDARRGRRPPSSPRSPRPRARRSRPSARRSRAASGSRARHLPRPGRRSSPGPRPRRSRRRAAGRPRARARPRPEGSRGCRSRSRRRCARARPPAPRRRRARTTSCR